MKGGKLSQTITFLGAKQETFRKVFLMETE